MISFLIQLTLLILNLFLLDKFIIFFTLKANHLFLDKPDSRSMHEKPTITGTGIIILMSCIFCYGTLFLFSQITSINETFLLKVIIISTPLSLLGFWDDYRGIKQSYRYFIQLLTGVSLLVNSNLFNINNFEISNNFLFFLIIFLLVLITGLINIVNFMDGIDGLVIGTFALIFLALTLKVNMNYVYITSILILFLRWNWNPAKVFIGDAGSTFIGAIYAGSILASTNFLESLSIFLMSMPLIFDTTFCLIWRLINGYNIFKAHKMHLYQRLVQGGLLHNQVSYIYIGSVGFISFFYHIGNILLELLASIIVLILGIYLHFNFAARLPKNRVDL